MQIVSVMDAVRIKDGLPVFLKVAGKAEADVHQFLWSDTLRADPRNRTVPLLDAFRLPHVEETVIVMLRVRRFNSPRFDTVGEAVSFFEQLFEVRGRRSPVDSALTIPVLQGIQFMHEHNVAHAYV